MEQVAPMYQPIAVEQKFELQLKNYPIVIFGYIDLITEDGLVIDHKTVGKKPTWTEKTVKTSTALTLYSAAYRTLYNKREKGVQLDLIPRSHTQDFQFLTDTRTGKDIKILLETLSTMDKMVSEDIWFPNLKACSTCPLIGKCNQSAFSPKLEL